MGILCLKTSFSGWNLAFAEAPFSAIVSLTEAFRCLNFDGDDSKVFSDMSNGIDFDSALWLLEELGWFKAPEVDFRMPWIGKLTLATLDLVQTIDGRDLCFFRASDCPAALISVATVAGGLTLGNLKEYLLFASEYEGGIGAC